MTVTAKALFQAVQAQATDTTHYTTPAGTRTILDKFTGTNTTIAPATVTVNIVAASTPVSAANTITSAKTLQAGESYTFPELVGHVLNPGDYINIVSGTASSISVRASGREVS